MFAKRQLVCIADLMNQNNYGLYKFYLTISGVHVNDILVFAHNLRNVTDLNDKKGHNFFII